MANLHSYGSGQTSENSKRSLKGLTRSRLLFLVFASIIITCITFTSTLLLLSLTGGKSFLESAACLVSKQRQLSCWQFSETSQKPVIRKGPGSIKKLLKPQPVRSLEEDDHYSDWEIATRVISWSFLRSNPVTTNGRIAFMFLVKGPIPLEPLWNKFLKGHEDLYSIYVHSSKNQEYDRSSMSSNLFIGRAIPGKPVDWGQMNMVHAERRLLAWALLETSNEYFVLISERCAPIRSFPFVYDYLMNSQHSFVDISVNEEEMFDSGTYSDGMLPEVPMAKFATGSQWFAIHKRHARALVADSLYYHKFNRYCKAGDEIVLPAKDKGNMTVKESGTCYPGEHYVQTFFHIMDPKGVSNTSVTFSNWSKKLSKPEVFKKLDVTPEKINQIQRLDQVHRHNKEFTSVPCFWNGEKSPCFLFLDNVEADALDLLMQLPKKSLGY